MNLIRNLLGLLICVSLLPICERAFAFIANMDFNYDEVFDELSLSQLRETMLIVYDLEVGYDELDFRYKKRDFRLSLVNGKLTLQPGSEFFLNDLDEMHFEVDGGCIYVSYERDGKSYRRVIARQEGIHLDDFSDCAHDERDDDSLPERLPEERQ